ncbi:MAG: radical SAM protein [bacterium]
MDRARVKEELYSRLGWISYDIPWLEEHNVEARHRERRALYEELETFPSISTDMLKPRHGPLSPGCFACRAGTWSCLFLNNRCNSNCFWCLRDRTPECDSLPSAHGLDFTNPEEYAVFLRRCGYNAVGFSGGEPLLSFRQLLDYTRTVRKRLGSGAWIWIYTNGILATAEKVSALAETGIDEIRVDIAANGYDLAPLERIAGHVPVLTVEIPCLPEDESKLERLLPTLQEIGVAHLHLHQLTANAGNVHKYLDRGYTFLHHPALTVLESEFAALRLLRRAAEWKLTMGVQICTKPYKRWTQGRSRRLRALQHAGSTPALTTVTATGFLRELIVSSPADSVGEVGSWLRKRGNAALEWQRIGESERFRVSWTALTEDVQENLIFSIDYREPMVVNVNSKQVSGGGQAECGWTTQFIPAGGVQMLTSEELHWLCNRIAGSRTDSMPESSDPSTVPERLAPRETPDDSTDFF